MLGLTQKATISMDERQKILCQTASFKKLVLNSKIGFANAWHRPRFKRIFVKKGIPIFTASQSRQLRPVPTKFISVKTNTKLDPLYLKKGQITITCSGNIGLSAMVTDTLKDKLFSHDLLRIECHDKRDAGYVYAFLKTKIGRDYVTASKYGSVISHIEPEHLASILIPNPPSEFKLQMSKMISRVYALKDEANTLLERANALLFDKLKIRPLEEIESEHIEEPICFTVPRTKLDSRLDGSFHMPVVGKIMTEIAKTKYPIATLGDGQVSNAVILPSRFKRTYVKDRSHGIPFLGSKDILHHDHPDVKYLSLRRHKKRITQLFLQENMVLVTCSGTIGNVVLCPRYYDNWSASQHIIRIIPSKQINAGYLYAYLASDYGRELIKRHSHGSVVDEVTDKQIASIPMPLPDREAMDRIGDPVLDASKKRDMAYKLEKEATRMVDDMVRNNQR